MKDTFKELESIEDNLKRLREIKDKIIPIDSKFSLENYNKMVEERDGTEKKKLETMNSLEVAFDDERNNVPDDYWKILEELKTGDSLRISIEKFGET
jgi:DNA anti-recombination protein RmuC